MIRRIPPQRAVPDIFGAHLIQRNQRITLGEAYSIILRPGSGAQNLRRFLLVRNSIEKIQVGPTLSLRCCDPHLNGARSLELAFLLAEMLNAEMAEHRKAAA
jgi:hypothetical protein